ncbi:YecA family protein [uncultured Thiothrix sp.]|uniref:YecA family protein n=1 Tax=uncultured Thiothrix sp. TaxID=223185 RepID=UPI002620BBE7|nr:YecA family protein [uncultured Thiothrix sp.]HMT92848.1 YecA family protein [Thiolinea sp.]
MDTQLPEFYTLEDSLLRVEADFTASEVHGIACAVLAFNNQYAEKAWQVQVLKGDAQDFYIQEARRLLKQLFNTTLEQLNSGDLGFELFLPPEQDSLDAQVAALQKWCQGFAFGLALSGLKTMQDLPEDTRDWVQDVVKIGAAGEMDVHDEDESETAFIELAEFVRVGVLLMNEELQPVRGRTQLTETSQELIE